MCFWILEYLPLYRMNSSDLLLTARDGEGAYLNVERKVSEVHVTGNGDPKPGKTVEKHRM